MERENLTPERIKNFATENGQSFLWDKKVPRLALRATAPTSRNKDGSKAFIFQGKFLGKDIRITIGNVEIFSVDEARKKATDFQKLIDDGQDPRIVKQERIAETVAKQEAASRKEAPALDVWKIYVTERSPKWSDAHKADHAKAAQDGGVPRKRGRRQGEPAVTQPGILRPLLDKPLQEITLDAVKDWLKGEEPKRPTHARLAFGLLRAFLNWCGDHKDYKALAHPDACAARVAKSVLPKKAAKDDCLQREQLPSWFTEVQKQTPVIAAYLQTCLLTGARRNELTGLKWADVDFRWKAMTIRDKVEGERTIPLTPYVAALLQGLKRINETPPPEERILNGKRIKNDLENWKPSEWVFFSKTSESGHIEEPRIAHTRATKAAGIPGISIHGLRRSFGTLAEWVECPAGISAQIMGHKPSATAEKHYRQRPLDLLRLWHTKIEGWILEQAGIPQPAEKAAPRLAAA